MGLSTLQEKIINAPGNKIFVNSAAASGKTTILTEKTRQLLRAGINPTEIVVITFTNNAANELRARLAEDYKDGLFIGTIHSLANSYLVRGGISTKELLDKADFDKLFILTKKNPQCIPNVDWLLLDEAQDSDYLQLNFIFNLIKPAHFFVVGDPRQAIYQWRGSRPDLLLKMTEDEGAYIYNLNENYRNKSNILSYAKQYLWPIGQKDDSIAMNYGGKVITSDYFVPTTLVNYIQKTDNYGDWAILCRNNEYFKLIEPYLIKANIPYDSFKQSEVDRDQLKEKMNANTVKLLTVHSAKGLEWKNVGVIGLFNGHKDEEYNVAYVAATRAKDLLIVMNIKKQRKSTYGRRQNEFNFE